MHNRIYLRPPWLKPDHESQQLFGASVGSLVIGFNEASQLRGTRIHLIFAYKMTICSRRPIAGTKQVSNTWA